MRLYQSLWALIEHMEAVCEWKTFSVLARHERKYKGRNEIWNTNLDVNSVNSVVVKGLTVEFGHRRLEFLCHISCMTLVLGTSKAFYSSDLWEHITFHSKKGIKCNETGFNPVYMCSLEKEKGCLCKCLYVFCSIITRWILILISGRDYKFCFLKNTESQCCNLWPYHNSSVLEVFTLVILCLSQ